MSPYPELQHGLIQCRRGVWYEVQTQIPEPQRVFNPPPESHHNYFFAQGSGAGVGEEKGEAGQETSPSAAALKRRWKCEVKGRLQAQACQRGNEIE